MSNDVRFKYDLGHYSMQLGRIGFLQTLSTIPVVAGDKISIDLVGVWRLSPLRRNLTMDARVDLTAYFMPYRHFYDEQWIDFIKEGIDEVQTFAGVDLGTTIASCLGAPYKGNVPTWLVGGYNRIWNRYWRMPTDTLERADGDIWGVDPLDAALGQPVCYMPAIWNTPIDGEVDAADLQVSTAGNVLDLTQLAQQKARLETERRREFMGRRYRDVMDRTFGTSPSVDQDERPRLLARQSFWLSGYDVDGTDAASLGNYSGKAAAVGGIQVPRQHYTEHGTIWVMCVVRFPPVHEYEVHYLTKKPDYSYREWAGDPDIMANEPPETVDLQDYFLDGFPHTQDAGIAPYGQWYRYHPNHVHEIYGDVDGFTFIDKTLSSRFVARYHEKNTYSTVFQTEQLGHWQSQARVNVEADRVIPPVTASIFAGSQ